MNARELRIHDICIEDQGEKRTYIYVQKSKHKMQKFGPDPSQSCVFFILCCGGGEGRWRREEVCEINFRNDEVVGAVEFVEADACGCVATRLNMSIAAVGAIAALNLNNTSLEQILCEL